MIVTCPTCFSADDVSLQRLPDRMVMYTCAGRHGGSGPHEWLRPASGSAADDLAADGVTDELLEPLLACVIAGEPFVASHRSPARRP